MLISFSFTNFKSFAETSTLSMVAHSAHKDLASALIAPDEGLPGGAQLLPVAAIYGANAAGKTNVIRAFDYFRSAILHSHASWPATESAGTGSTPHSLHKAQPSRFEAEFVLEGVRYRYGFEAYPTHFSSEWLFAYPKRRERMLFLRNTSRAGEWETSVSRGPSLTGEERELRSAERRTRHNSLYLAVAAQDNQREGLAIQNWIKRKTEALKKEWDMDDYAFTSRVIDQGGSQREAIISMLRAADSNLVDVKVKVRDVVPDVSDMDEYGLEPDTLAFVAENRKYDVEFTFSDGEKVFSLPLADQSDGLKRMYGFASVLSFVLAFGEIMMIDELESSLHPHISSQIVNLFQSPTTNPKGAQLVFTTHDTNLLSEDLLRRDQIWFVEKDHSSSSLYSLLEFRPRKDENIELGYLRGRFGAVPTKGMAAGIGGSGREA